jgi:Cu+-exporting ATPase
MVGTGQAARRGIYIRNGEALETSSKLTTLVFDKTGTITEGKPVVTDFLAAESQNEAAIATLATFVASAEAPSEHFLGQALAAWARERGAKTRAAKDFNATPGRGVQAVVSGKTIRIGNAALLDEAGIDTGDFAAQAEAWSGEGKTPVFVAVGNRCAALLAVADRPREGAKEAIALLHRLGLTTVMATGDLEATAQHIARQVGIDRVVARATPADKLELVRRLQAEGRKVGMVGDGINDAPALAAADVGFAIGSGADIALESADITLVGGDIARVASGIELSRRTMSVIRQNLFWALGYNTVAIPVAAAGRLNPMIASAAMAMSSVSVLSNSLRLQR